MQPEDVKLYEARYKYGIFGEAYLLNVLCGMLYIIIITI